MRTCFLKVRKMAALLERGASLSKDVLGFLASDMDHRAQMILRNLSWNLHWTPFRSDARIALQPKGLTAKLFEYQGANLTW